MKGDSTMLYLKSLVFHYNGEDLKYLIPEGKEVKFNFQSQSREVEYACIKGFAYGAFPSANFEEANSLELVGITVADEKKKEEKLIGLPKLSKTFRFPAWDMKTAENMVNTVGERYASYLGKA